MSTNIKKLYTLKDIETAKANNAAVKNYYARKKEKRITVQVRISERWYEELKRTAKSERMIISFLLDRIVMHFYSNYKRQ